MTKYSHTDAHTGRADRQSFSSIFNFNSGFRLLQYARNANDDSKRYHRVAEFI